MRFEINRNELSAALAAVGKAVAARPQLPILAAVKVEAEDEGITLRCFDGEINIAASAEANVTEDGAVCIDYKMLSGIVSNMTAERITVRSDKAIHIVGGKSQFDIEAINADDYPNSPELTFDAPMCEVPAAEFISAVKQVIPFAAVGEGKRPALCGVMMTADGERLTLAASDGYRVAEIVIRCSAQMEKPIIIPATACKTLTEICKDTEIMAISAGDRNVTFCCRRCMMMARLIDGQFIDYKRAFELSYTVTATADRRLTLECIDRAMVLINAESKTKKPPVKIDVRDNRLTLSCVTARGDNRDVIQAETSGEMTIAFNARYLADALNACGGDTVTMELSAPNTGCRVRDGGARFLLLPVRMY